jgi:fructan beta-fructosidase
VETQNPVRIRRRDDTMSESDDRDYRPNLHFTASRMWLNDPNGMFFLDGIYHLFYQHYPNESKWGPMHWGHAISKNLLDWEHLPIALYPDELGFAFSGSCLYDKENVSKLGKGEKSPLLAIYTRHNPQDHTETQNIAYSTDFVNFEKYSGNPVIPNPGLKDFRDPKVFWNPVHECWSIVLAANNSVFFYRSANLIDWKYTGEFSTKENGAFGICECPDCIAIETEEGMKWVLIISMILESDDTKEPFWKTQYFVGDFDGNTFINTERSEDVLWLNYGFDHYAGVVFQNTAKPILMAWANNWAYAGKVPTSAYQGQMSLACEVKLQKTYKGYRVTLLPIAPEPKESRQILSDGGCSLESQTFGLVAEGRGDGRIIIQNDFGEKLIIEVKDDEIIVDRSNADRKDFSEAYQKPEYGKVVVQRYTQGDFKLQIIFDVSIVEVFAEDGLIPITMSAYPHKPYDSLLLEGNMTSGLITYGM